MDVNVEHANTMIQASYSPGVKPEQVTAAALWSIASAGHRIAAVLERVVALAEREIEAEKARGR